MDAPRECLNAGLDGTGRDDWRECDEIMDKEERDRWDDDYEDYPDEKHNDEPRDWGCALLDCQEGYYCIETEDGARCISDHDSDPEDGAEPPSDPPPEPSSDPEPSEEPPPSDPPPEPESP